MFVPGVLNRLSLAQIKIWPRIVHQIWHVLSCGGRWAPRTSRKQQVKLSRPNGLGPRMMLYNKGYAIGQRTDCTTVETSNCKTLAMSSSLAGPDDASLPPCPTPTYRIGRSGTSSVPFAPASNDVRPSLWGKRALFLSDSAPARRTGSWAGDGVDSETRLESLRD